MTDSSALPIPEDTPGAPDFSITAPGTSVNPLVPMQGALPQGYVPGGTTATTVTQGYVPGAVVLADPSSSPFAARLRASEGNTASVNPQGYAGSYQFGTSRLADLGLYQPADGEDLKTNQWKGQLDIPGFPQVKTLEDFTSGPDAAKAQAAAYNSHIGDIDLAIATTPGANAFSQDGLRAVAHLGGIDGMRKFVQTGGQYSPGDANGTTLGKYYAKFSGNAPVPGTAQGGSIFGPGQANPLMPAAAQEAPGAGAWVPPSASDSGPAKPVINPLLVGAAVVAQALGGFKATPVGYDPFAVMPKNLASFGASPWQTQIASGNVNHGYANAPAPRSGKPVIGNL